MNPSILSDLGLFNSHAPQHSSGLGIIPILRKEPSSQDYISLHQAFQQHTIVISEVSEGGSVPNLKVRNTGKTPVLILDGEELLGAKQNRILNTSVLIGADTELIVPVSCTELGRWSYRSRDFQESGEVLSSRSRSFKMGSVTDSLKENRGHASNQGKIWDDISELHESLKTHSGTEAMHDAYEQRRQNIDEVIAAFPLIEGQCGFYAQIDGRFAGLDLVSRPEIWKDLHAKVVRSYVVDVLDRRYKDGKPDPQALATLFELFAKAQLNQFPAVGLGQDLRLEHDTFVASALVWDGSLTHLAAYPRMTVSSNEVYSSPRHRRL